LAEPKVAAEAAWPARSRITCINACDGFDGRLSKWLFGWLVDMWNLSGWKLRNFDNGHLGFRGHLFAPSANSKQ
jgi:hypothetical protein